MNRLIKYEWKNRHSLNGMDVEKGKDYEFKSRSVCSKFSRRAGIYTLMMNLKRDLDHRVLMIFFVHAHSQTADATPPPTFIQNQEHAFPRKI